MLSCSPLNRREQYYSRFTEGEVKGVRSSMTCPGLQSWKLQAGLPDSYSVLFTGCWVLWMEHVPAPLVYRNLIPHVIGRWGLWEAMRAEPS